MVFKDLYTIDSEILYMVSDDVSKYHFENGRKRESHFICNVFVPKQICDNDLSDNTRPE
jgi:hypothetical protein